MELESRVRRVRQSRGLSQAELARAVGLSPQALSAVEAGRYVPNTAVALRLAQVLGCAVEDLFVGLPPPRCRCSWRRRHRPRGCGWAASGTGW
ncbi:MAG: helix-turn-helix transcriptional regulator [Armatimonadota bacterium]|nr:helix-turn-helix transcriptional regulator [Armatimonadota bacterium]MDW8155017.1 helix-turn-helix transcriptional regulator [Armatimonadota bacterium]